MDGGGSFGKHSGMRAGGKEFFMKKKVCLVIPSLQAGGMERVMTELAWNFSSQQNLELHLILYGITREIFYAIPDNLIIHKPAFDFNNGRRLHSTVKTLLYLRKTVKRINPGSILSFGEYWNNFVLLALSGTRYPVFVSDRSQPDKSLGKLHDTLRRWLYPRARGVILQTEKAKEVYLSKHKHWNIAVIGNPVRIIVAGKEIDKKEKIVLMVGRLIETKHQDKLIEMFAKVSPPDWKLMLVGYDHLKQQHLERLKALANKLEVGHRVVFTGKQEDIEQVYLESSIFAFTSSSEGFPNVIGEAMSAGLPVVAFDCIAGPSEMITDGKDGFLVPLFNSDVFESKLADLIGNEALRESLGSNARKSIRRFSPDIICDTFLQFIIE